MKTEPLPPMPGNTLEHLRPDQICDEPPALFSLGNVVATPAALTLIQEHAASVSQLLNQHQTGDWREMCKEDRDTNWQAGVDPFSRTPYSVTRRSPRCPIPKRHIQRNFASR